MSTHNIHFHDKIKKKIKYIPKYIVFVILSCRKNLLGTEKRVRVSHGKRVIGVRVIEGFILYCSKHLRMLKGPFCQPGAQMKSSLVCQARFHSVCNLGTLASHKND